MSWRNWWRESCGSRGRGAGDRGGDSTCVNVALPTVPLVVGGVAVSGRGDPEVALAAAFLGGGGGPKVILVAGGVATFGGGGGPKVALVAGGVATFGGGGGPEVALE